MVRFLLFRSDSIACPAMLSRFRASLKDMCVASPDKFLHSKRINAVQSFLICFSFSMCQINIHELAYAQYVNHLGHVVVFCNLLASS